MEINYSDLKKKKVVNILDGKVLGYICDIRFSFPEGKIQSYLCADNRGVFCREEYVLCPCDVNKIGDDTVLVCLKENNCKKECRKPRNDDCEEDF